MNIYQASHVSELRKFGTAPLVERYPTFRDNVVVMNISVVQYETVRLPAMPGINHPATLCHTPQERRFQLHRCASLEVYSQSTTNNMGRFAMYLFLQDALLVSDGFSVRHQELKPAHTKSGICQTVTITCC